MGITINLFVINFKFLKTLSQNYYIKKLLLFKQYLIHLIGDILSF
jgi:hypothetical protein